MLFKFKKGTPIFVGMLPAALPADTELELEGAKTLDQVAKVLVQAGQKIFGDHLESLKHEETVSRAGKNVRVAVSYGAGGARIETEI